MLIERRSGTDRRTEPRATPGRRSSDWIARRCMACGKTICKMSIRDALKPGETLEIICTCNEVNRIAGPYPKAPDAEPVPAGA